MGYVWRNLFQRKLRTGLSMLGVSVSVAGIVALISVAQGMRTSLDRYMEASGASLTVFSGDAADLAFSRVTTDDIAAIAALPGVEAVARANFAAVMGPKLGEGRKPVPLLLCFGRLPGERIMEKYRGLLTEGRMPQSRSELLAGSFVARRHGLGVGERFPLFPVTYLGIEQYEVVGIYDSDITWENGGIVVHAEILQQKLDARDSFALLFVYTAAGERDRVRARIEADLPHLVAMPSGEFTQRFASQMEFLDEVIALITAIALVIGVLGVLNTMMMSVSERTREIGTLRALGWPRGLVLRVILAEGILLSVLGGLVGLGLGVLGTEALVRWFQGEYLQALYETSTFAKGMAVALVVGLLAALYPALRAANLSPVEALRHE